MLRRVSSSVARPSGARSISAYEFGHPTMNVEYIKASEKAEAQDMGVKTLKLPNGARIIAHQRGGIQAGVGMYVEAGAKQDPTGLPGLSYVLRWSLTNSNMENSMFQIDRQLRAVGASQEHVEIEKRLVGWKVEAPANQWVKPATDLMTCMSAPRFPEYDIERFRDTMDNIVEELRWQQPRQYVVDKLETVAFFREPLGNFRYVAPEHNDDASHKALLNQWASLCVPSNVIISGVNVDIEELAAAYENAPFPHSETAPHHKAAKKAPLSSAQEEKQYTPGMEFNEQESRAKNMGVHPEMEEETIVAMGYRTFGRNQSTKDFATALVLHQLVNVASQDVLAVIRHNVHFGLRSFYRPYSSTGLIGFTVRQLPGDINAALKDGVKMVQTLNTDAKAVNAAVQRAKVAFHNDYLELNRDYADFLASSLNAQGTTFTSAAEIVAAIEAVKPADVKKAVEAMQAERPCMYSTGSTYKLPSLRQLGL